MTGIKQKYQDLFFQTEQTVNRKKSGFRTARQKVPKSNFHLRYVATSSFIPVGNHQATDTKIFKDK